MNKTYVTLLSTPNYIDGVKVLNKSLRKYSDIPLLCVCSKSLPEASIKQLADDGINCHRLQSSALEMANINNLVPGTRPHWQFTFDKLMIWGLTEYDKMVFLDADMLVCDTIDELFDWPDMSAVQCDALLDSNRLHLNSGMMVIEPNEIVLQTLIENVESTITECRKNQPGVGDQDVIQRVFSHWPEYSEKHIPFRYNIYFKDVTYYYRNHLKEGTPKIVHFSATGKPWVRQSLKINIGIIISIIEHNIRALKYHFEYKKLLGRFL